MDMIAEICDKHTLECVHIYPIVGLSGTDVQRSTRFGEALAQLKRPDIAGVVLASVDRFMRATTLSSMEIFKAFESVPDKHLFFDIGELDPLVLTDQQTLANDVMAAGRERERIIQRTHWAVKKNRLRADKRPEALPDGVSFDKVSKTFAYVPDEAEKIKLAFQLADEGVNYEDICRRVGWVRGKLKSVLRNKWWIGYKVVAYKYEASTFNPKTDKRKTGKRIKLETPIETRTNLADSPLVSLDMFDRIQSRLDNPKSTFTHRRAHTSLFLGANNFYCGECGHKMYGQVHWQKLTPQMYRCSSYYGEKNRTLKLNCNALLHNPEEIDRAVWVEFLLHTKSANVLAEYTGRQISTDESFDIQRRTLDIELEDLLKLLAGNTRMLERDQDEDLYQRRTELKEQIAKCRSQIAELAKEQAKPRNIEQIVSLVKQSPKLTVEDRRALLCRVVDKVIIKSAQPFGIDYPTYVDEPLDDDPEWDIRLVFKR